jgi:hypothetical protein
MSQSILDQVLSSQKMSAISGFDPAETASKLFGILNEREQDIITKRYGLNGKGKSTLEEIGKSYSVTRERIRQVENSSLKRIQESFNETILKELEYLINNILEDHGDIMTEDRLVKLLLAAEDTSPTDGALVRFLLNQILPERLEQVKDSDAMYKSWSLPGTDWDIYHSIIKQLTEIISTHGEPLALELLLNHARQQIKLENEMHENFENIILNYLDITKKIEENKFNEWGLSHWNSIKPRRMNDKIYMIMKKEGKPMHFVDIAKRINETAFDTRIAYPATIHNELILDDKYVLVGRGIYALKEWGYKPGVVLDVIKDTIRKSPKPLTRDGIIEEVLKNRMVKRSTVILALMNKKHFVKNTDGTYRLAE